MRSLSQAPRLGGLHRASRLPFEVSFFTSAVILNTGKSFELKAIEGSQMPIEGFHGFKNKDIEKVSYRSPEFYLRA